MKEFNSGIVVSTLKQVVSILDKNNISYRFLGSVVLAAINGNLHRELGDLDLLIDKKGKEILTAALMEKGYKPAGGMFAFARKYLALETLQHSEFLEVGYFYGTWQKNGSFVLGDKKIKVIVDAVALIPTQYKLHGVPFIGLPPEAIARGIYNSKENPKRQKEILLLDEKKIKPLNKTYIHVKLFGFQADWMYRLEIFLLNIIGGYRVKRGLAFDPWR